MFKHTLLLPLVLLAPLLARAECGVTSTGEGLAVVVGPTSNKCFTSETFRQAFKAQLVASVAEMEAEPERDVRSRRRSGPRISRAQKQWTTEEGAAQPTVPAGRYFGQR